MSDFLANLSAERERLSEVLTAQFRHQRSRKTQGAYYTPPRLATSVARLAIGSLETGCILDPACGTGDLLLAALRTTTTFEAGRQLVEDRLFGVDLSPGSVEVARMRLQQELATRARTPSELELVRELRTNLRCGNSLVGALRVDGPRLRYEQATWDDEANAEGKPLRRAPTRAELRTLRPFDWAHEFPDVAAAGGFDVILTNPPWDIFKPNPREFFGSPVALTELMQRPGLRRAWLKHLSEYRTATAYFRESAEYQHQSSTVNGRATGSDTNLYKLFTERCFHLLRRGGRCTLVVPSGLYTDLGAKGLRELLFEQARITGLVAFENRRLIFEDIHRSFKFIVLSFQKEPGTERFSAAFMRHDLADLESDPPRGSVTLETKLIRTLAPDSLSIMELKSERDVAIAEKLVRHPRLRSLLKLTSELHMTSDAALFQKAPRAGSLPLYEGKMIWQFDPAYCAPRYWVDEGDARGSLLGREPDEGQLLDYQQRRLAVRAIAANTNERTLIATMLPKGVVCGNSLLVSQGGLAAETALYFAAVLNSFVADAFVRNAVTSNINLFYLYQLPIPAPDATSPTVRRIVACSKAMEEAEAPARLSLRAEIDALVARLYGLTNDELRHVLSTFPLVSDEVKTATLNSACAAA